MCCMVQRWVHEKTGYYCRPDRMLCADDSDARKQNAQSWSMTQSSPGLRLARTHTLNDTSASAPVRHLLYSTLLLLLLPPPRLPSTPTWAASSTPDPVTASTCCPSSAAEGVAGDGRSRRAFLVTSFRTLHASALQNRARDGSKVAGEAAVSSSSAVEALVAGPETPMLSSESFGCTRAIRNVGFIEVLRQGGAGGFRGCLRLAGFGIVIAVDGA